MTQVELQSAGLKLAKTLREMDDDLTAWSRVRELMRLQEVIQAKTDEEHRAIYECYSSERDQRREEVKKRFCDEFRMEAMLLYEELLSRTGEKKAWLPQLESGRPKGPLALDQIADEIEKVSRKLTSRGPVN